MRTILICAILAFGVITSSVSEAAQPARFNYQAKLTDSGGLPLNGVHTLTIRLYQGGTAGSANSGTQVYQETATPTFTNGVANHVVGTGTGQIPGALTASMLNTSSDIFLQIAVDDVSNVVLPRTRLESVPFSILSADGEARIPISQPGGGSFPITISQPGSYYLTGNLTDVGPGAGVSITTSGVKLDLNGYSIIGTGGGGTLGVACNTAGVKNLEVCNGRITNCNIGISFNNVSNAWVHDMNLSGNQNVGVRVGAGAIVEDCVANDLSSPTSNVYGIFVSSDSTVRQCQVANIQSAAASSNAIGISGGIGASVLNCSASNVGSIGTNTSVSGITVSNNSRVEGCIARGNYNSGSSGVTIGIAAGPDSLILNNVSTNNSAADSDSNGIRVGNSSLVSGNDVTSNTAVGASNFGVGIAISSTTRVENNNVVGNIGVSGGTGYGIYARFSSSSGNVIVKNTTIGHTTAGIRCENTSGANYHGENIQKETTPFSQASMVNVAGTGDRADVAF
ncbi:MAG: hypothetical protein K1X53_03880 [Candidatus Sumerlaeaceae bacterium]|nr:hypothetical protein [Candidatus Sumerlaeaceae bacterium]